MRAGATREIATRLGRRTLDPARIINFPRGLAGFENEHGFALLELKPDAPLLMLQSMSRTELGFLVADPYSFLDSYPVTLGMAEQELLNLTRPEDAVILVTVTVPVGQPENAMLNLSGPIVINHQARLALQVPQYREGPTQVRLHRT